ncbi:hypothetical protein PCI56_26725 [Plesiomonas shigelloides subsp. oncorhynchi]|nr:hypothetical protein [Plesiomonas shigelloides]
MTDWLTPFYPDPTVNPLHAAWPDELNDAVIAKIRDLCANSHPMLVARAEWAELQLLSEIDCPQSNVTCWPPAISKPSLTLCAAS